jgi:phosphoenolpyruvate carboxykinase (GTP)
MADYFDHWIEFREKLGYNAPKIFFVNWFRRNQQGHFLWPGFDENSRVLKWIAQRLQNAGQTQKTPIGFVPTVNGLDLRGVDRTRSEIEQLLKVDEKEWETEIASLKTYFNQFDHRLPTALKQELAALEDRFKSVAH